MFNNIKNWLNKSDGGEWYEPIVANLDIIKILTMTILFSTIIIGGCLLV